MKKNPNNNCLAGMRCPMCGSYGPFGIVGSTLFEVYDDGTEGHGDIEWDDGSFCECRECGHNGTKADFTEPFNPVAGYPSNCGCNRCVIARQSQGAERNPTVVSLPCPECDGTGKTIPDSDGDDMCPRCLGTGKVPFFSNN